MKLAEIFQETKVHPDLIPAMDKLTNKLVKRVRAAGVEIMPARESLSHGRYVQKLSGGYDFNKASRWDSPTRYGQPSWLVGYIKMGVNYLSIWLRLDGTIITKDQYKGGESEHYYRYYKDDTDFVTYLKDKFKPFVSKDSAQRFFEFLNKSTPAIYYNPPESVAPSEGGLEDKDEFEKPGGLKKDYGVVAAATHLANRIKSGEQIDPNAINVMINTRVVHEWAAHSGYDLALEGYGWVVITPDEVYVADHNDAFQSDVADWPSELLVILKTYARKIRKTVVSRAQNMAKKPPAPPPESAEQRLLRAIYGDNPPQINLP